MWKYILKRIVGIVPMLLIISIISFGVMYLAPGDPVSAYITPNMHKEDIDNIREQLGFNRPVYIQYLEWLKKTVTGDLGFSTVDYRPVLDKILERIPATLILTGTSLLISLIIGFILGTISAVYENSLIDKIISIFSYIGISIPTFWFGILLIIVFSVKIGMLPSIGMHSIGDNSFGDLIKHLILPSITLSCFNTSVITRYMRSNIISQKNEDYVKVARGKGIKEGKIYIFHILKNSTLPLITILGLALPDLITGAFITESVFGWPGMGRLGVQSVFSQDYPVIMGITMISSVLLILGNLIADVLYSVADPRIRNFRR